MKSKKDRIYLFCLFLSIIPVIPFIIFGFDVYNQPFLSLICCMVSGYVLGKGSCII
jgi:hypothetical protein